MTIHVLNPLFKGGPIRWSKVAKEIPHRTDAMCTQRWRQLSSDDDVVQQYKVQVMSKTVVNSGKCQEEGTITKAALEVCVWVWVWVGVGVGVCVRAFMYP